MYYSLHSTDPDKFNIINNITPEKTLRSILLLIKFSFKKHILNTCVADNMKAYVKER